MSYSDMEYEVKWNNELIKWKKMEESRDLEWIYLRNLNYKNSPRELLEKLRK